MISREIIGNCSNSVYNPSCAAVPQASWPRSLFCLAAIITRRVLLTHLIVFWHRECLLWSVSSDWTLWSIMPSNSCRSLHHGRLSLSTATFIRSDEIYRIHPKAVTMAEWSSSPCLLLVLTSICLKVNASCQLSKAVGAQKLQAGFHTWSRVHREQRSWHLT